MEHCNESTVTLRNLLLRPQGGDLRAALTADREGHLGWYRSGKGIALDILRGLHFLHASHVIHRGGSLWRHACAGFILQGREVCACDVPQASGAARPDPVLVRWHPSAHSGRLHPCGFLGWLGALQCAAAQPGPGSECALRGGSPGLAPSARSSLTGRAASPSPSPLQTSRAK